MKRKTMIATAAVLAIGGAVSLGALSYAPDAFAQAQGADARLARFQRMCSDGPARLAGMIAYAEVKLGLRAEQRPAWEQLTTAVRSAVLPLQRVCAQTTALPEPADVLGRLEMGERFMTAGLEAIRTIRPVLAQFQATLSPEQRESLTQLMGRGGGRWGGHGRMGWGMGPGGPPGMPPAPGGNAPPPPARN